MAHFQDDFHALRCGFLYGILMRAGVPFTPDKDDDGNYLPTLTIRIPDEKGLPPIEIRVQVLP
jgi:hypothetical protein